MRKYHNYVVSLCIVGERSFKVAKFSQFLSQAIRPNRHSGLGTSGDLIHLAILYLDRNGQGEEVQIYKEV